ncbi:hypothetical protein NtRootA9_28880 [Arthrobacter sp. NtRootA9]|nr:hypothetical protein NtRootA9_28880 [Arthrobacter sp. NtRootA9]
MIAQGNEVWSNSVTHSDPGNTWAGMVDEIQNSRIELEGKGLTVMGWQMAGTATSNPNYGSNFTKASQFANPAGKLLMANYGRIKAYAGGALRVLPTCG